MSALLASLFATVLANAWILDGTGRDAFVGWIEVDGARIVAVGEGANEDPNAVDLTGRTVLPGLAEMHVHLGELDQAKWMLKLLLAHGVTNVKDSAIASETSPPSVTGFERSLPSRTSSRAVSPSTGAFPS